MKITISIVLMMSLSSFQTGIASEYLGTFKTKPTVFPGFSEPYSEKMLKVINRLTLHMTITEKYIVVVMSSNDEIKMRYRKEGNFLLGEEDGAKINKYVPFYVENKDTIHGISTIFFRTK